MKRRMMSLVVSLGLCFPAVAETEKPGGNQAVITSRPANSAASSQVSRPDLWAAPGDAARPDTESVAGKKAVRGEVLVAFRPGVDRGRADAVRARLGASEVDELGEIGVRVWQLPPGLAVAEAVGALSRAPEVRFAEPNVLMSILADEVYPGPADPSFLNPSGWPFGYQEHLRHDGATAREIHAEEAWAAACFGADVVVAVVDTGVDLDHPDLDGSLYRDAAGTIIGGNFFSTRSVSNGAAEQHALAPGGGKAPSTGRTPMDDHGHGTHVAGLIAAEMNNTGDQLIATPAATDAWKGGVVGVAPAAKIMPVKVLDSTGSGSADGIAKGILFAADHNAKIINLSLGGPSSQTMSDAINYAWSKDVLVIAAAGNSGSEYPQFPASELHAMAVAAVDSSDKCASFSNRGWWVDVAAPGVSVLSSFIDGTGAYNNGYGRMSGTSMACPVTAGVAALIRARHPSLSAEAVMAQLLATAENVDADNPGLEGKLGTGRVNALGAVGAVASPIVSVQGLGSRGGTISGLGSSDLIFVKFSHAVNAGSALNPANYQLYRADNTPVELVLSSTDYQPFPGQGIELRVAAELPVGQYRFVVGSALVGSEYVHPFAIAPMEIPVLRPLLPLASLAYQGTVKGLFRPVNTSALGAEAEPNNTLVDAGSFPAWYSVGGNRYRTVMEGSISVTNDLDYYWLPANAGDVVPVELHSLDPTGAYDCYLELRDTNDTVLAYNDDRDFSRDSRIYGFVIHAAGDYYVCASSYRNRSTGPYHLTVYQTTGTAPTPFSAPPPTVPRMFSLDVTAGQTVATRIDVSEESKVRLYHNNIEVTPGPDTDPGPGVQYPAVGPLDAGAFVIAVEPLDPFSTAGFSVEVVVDAELEQVGANDTAAEAQPINPYFQPLDGSAVAWRSAMVGRLQNWDRIYEETPGRENDLRGSWDLVSAGKWAINMPANAQPPVNCGVRGTVTAVRRSVQTDRWFIGANEGDLLSFRIWGKDSGGGTASSLWGSVEISGPGWTSWFYGGAVGVTSDYELKGFIVPQSGRCTINVWCRDYRLVGSYTLTVELISGKDLRADKVDHYKFTLQPGHTCELGADPRVDLQVQQSGLDYDVAVTPKVGGLLDYGLVLTVNAAFDGPTANETWDSAQALGQGALGHVGGGGLAGYYTDRYEGTRAPEPAISRAGMTPLQISDLATFDFSLLKVLMLHTQNEPLSTNLVLTLPAIEAWVRQGGILVIHDRRVSSKEGVAESNPLLVGSPGTQLERNIDYGTDLNVITAGTLVTSGPGGQIDNTTLDGGYYSSHGFAYGNTLPPGTVSILSAGPDPARVAAFRYPLGNGQVYYSSIPLDWYLDYYLDAGASDPVIRNFATIYAPNVVAYASSFGPSDLADWYRLGSLGENTLVSIETRTPGDSPGAFANQLNPFIELWSDSTGTLVQIEGVKTVLPDGRNEAITHLVTAAGTYYVRATAEGGTLGEYILVPGP